MKRNLYWLLILFIPSSVFGQIFFGPENVIIDDETDIYYPSHVFSEDIDADGDLDVIAGTFTSDGKIVWYEKFDGLYNYSIQQTINVQNTQVWDMLVEDLDNDGDLDVVAYLLYEAKVVWYAYDAESGKFGPQQIITTQVPEINKIFAADIDNDGDIDILTDASTQNSVSWYENTDGLGAFGPSQIIYSQNGNAYAVEAHDIDNDGDIDVVSTYVTDNDEDIVAWYENIDGEGTFSEEHIITIRPDSPLIDFGVADIDNDDDLDIYFLSRAEKLVAWFENENGLGDFGAEHVIAEQNFVPTSIKSSDVDGDGDEDVLVFSYFDESLSWYENENGLGAFGARQIITTNMVTPGLSYDQNWFALNDLDGDLDKDLILTSYNGGKLGIFANIDGAGNFQPQHIIFKEAENPRHSQIADMDNDGDFDVLASSFGDVRIAWYENIDGQGKFIKQIAISTQPESSFQNSAVDIDGDGDLDVIAVSSIGITWYENVDGQGTFGGNHLITNETDDCRSFFVGDIDGDNDLDVVSSSQNDLKIAWYENLDGLGSFGPQQVVLDSIYYPRSIYLEDMDNDSDLDIVVAFPPGGLIIWYENIDGQGTFNVEHLVDPFVYASVSIIVKDIDGDSDKDILYADISGDTIGWYENENGLGAFGEKQIVSLETWGVNAIHAADIDLDGDFDVLSASGLDQKVAWYENLDGQGVFGPQKIISIGSTQPNSVYAGDLDGDGDLDVVFTSDYDDKIAWHENLMNTPAISGFCFYDENENKEMDNGEVGLLNHSVMVEPGAILNFTDENGRFFFTFEEGDYTISNQPIPNWELITDSSSYEVTVQGTAIQNINFGLKPIQEITHISGTVNSAPTRCGFDVPFWINIENRGTTFNSGQISFEIDSLCTFVDANPYPSIIQGNTLIWDYSDLAPTYSEGIELVLQMPGAEHLGTFVFFDLTVFITDELGNIQEHSGYEYHSQVNCAYDPNDKLVFPYGVQEENYTLFGEELEYTIRFQNTGTDTAFTVRVEDQLDENLDWNTFQPIAASHSYVANLYDNGIAEFLFEDILLPDSTTNEIESHGFVKYRIKPLDGLPQNTAIENTADIFFDFNPPIETNTTLNTAYECGAAMQLELSSILICEQDILIGSAFDLIDSTEFQWELNDVETYIGNSFSWNADTAGVFELKVSSSNAICQRDTNIQIEVFPTPIVELSGFPFGMVCQNYGPVNLPPGSPSGGVYSGLGVDGDQFDPAQTGLGTHWIYYTFTDVNGCFNTDSVSVLVEICASISELNKEIIQVFPNPFEDFTTIRIDEIPGGGEASLELVSVNGKALKKYQINSNSEIKISGESLTGGIYFFNLKNKNGIVLGRGKLIKM